MNKIYLPDQASSCMAPTYFRFPILLLFFVLLHAGTRAQEPVNAYAQVTAIDPTKKILTITNLDQSHGSFGAGRQVIVIQMQDNVIGNTGNNSNFGSLGTIGQAGLYEVATIQSINTSTLKITLAAPLRKNYNTDPNNSRVQVVSFNQLGNPDFLPGDDITASPWNGNTGGIIAFQVTGTLYLNHSINADGAGFRGGVASINSSITCDGDMYINSSTNYGKKGEGIYRSNSANYDRARGRILTGGGGGNGRNGGGAGGGNYTTGGNGGPGLQCDEPGGGLGGIALNTYIMTGSRLFMGGGGGGGQGNNNAQTKGGNGGGIILIKANAISFGIFQRISANGESTDDTDEDGAGGAGAGGTILLQVNGYNFNFFEIQANGGNGGNVTDNTPRGGGGGGAQGALLFSGARPTGFIILHTENGQGGLNSQQPGASRAGNGGGVNDGGIVTDVGTPLPVRLLNFAAEKNDTKTRLTWTATDELNSQFHVQHSTDGSHYTTIGTVSGSGKGTAITNYSFMHHVPAPGINYYRLEMIEEPEYKTYSSIVTVRFNDLPATPVAYPNPAKDHFSMRITDINNNTNYDVRITDLAGKIVYTGSHRPVSNIITVQTGLKLLPGIYIVTVNMSTRTHFVKLVIE